MWAPLARASLRSMVCGHVPWPRDARRAASNARMWASRAFGMPQPFSPSPFRVTVAALASGARVRLRPRPHPVPPLRCGLRLVGVPLPRWPGRLLLSHGEGENG